MNKIDRIKELVEVLNKASHYYYNENKPIMENREYNALYDELEDLEKESNVILSNSPTQRAGYPVVSNLPKVKHDIPLLSLGKRKKIPDLISWLGNKEGILMLKLDGGTGKAEYNNKYLRQLSTRGDSDTNIGEDITHNKNSIKGIPLSIDDENEIQIVGENYMTYSAFNKINEKILNEDDKYANPRNLANGSVGLLDSKECRNRNIQFCAFNIIKGNRFKTKIEQFEWLNSQGFETVQYWVVDKSNLENTIENIIDLIPTFDFPIDGLVLTFNDIEYGLSLGSTNHAPNHSISFKFEDDWFETRHKYIEWNTSRFGRIVGTGIFESIKIEGTDVNRATLHNLDRFWALKLGKDDYIEVSKRNKIIPAIENNITRSNTEKIPTVCPCCEGEVEIRKVVNTHDLYCLNPDCDAKIVKKISHYCSKKALNIVGISQSTITKLIDNGFIETIPDIYKLEQYRKQIMALDGMGETSYENLINSVNTSRICNTNNFIYGLGIKEIGSGTAKKITNYFNNNFNDFLNAVDRKFDFTIIEDVGDKTQESIYKWFKQEENKEMVYELLKYIKFNQDKNEKETNTENQIFSGMKIYCTGSFAGYKKDELKQIVERLGGEFTSGYAKSLDYLVVGSLKGSSKEDKAIKDGVKILTEQQFEELIRG